MLLMPEQLVVDAAFTEEDVVGGGGRRGDLRRQRDLAAGAVDPVALGIREFPGIAVRRGVEKEDGRARRNRDIKLYSPGNVAPAAAATAWIGDHRSAALARRTCRLNSENPRLLNHLPVATTASARLAGRPGGLVNDVNLFRLL